MYVLMCMGIHSYFSAIFARETSFVTPSLLSWVLKPFEKGSTKEFAPLGHIL